MMDAGLRLFHERFQHNASDPSVRKAYYNYQMEMWDEQNRIETARLEGQTEGRAAERAENQKSTLEMVRRLRIMGMSNEQIAYAINLPIEDVEHVFEVMPNSSQ